MVSRVGLEPTRYCYLRILSHVRLSISPIHSEVFNNTLNFYGRQSHYRGSLHIKVNVNCTFDKINHIYLNVLLHNKYTVPVIFIIHKLVNSRFIISNTINKLYCTIKYRQIRLYRLKINTF